MINILLEGFDIDAPWLYDELKNYIKPNLSVAVVAFSFRDNRVKSLSDWNALYAKGCGKYHDGIVGGFTAYGIPEENVSFINYFTDTKETAAQKIKKADISEAARLLYTTQPSVSKAIKALENDMGIVLFDRMPRGIVLTAQGREAYRYACRIVNDSRKLEEMSHQNMVKYLRISLNPSSWFTNQFVEFYKKNYEKNYHFEVYTAGVRTVMERVRDYLSDIGFVYVMEQQKKEFQYELTKNRLVFQVMQESTATFYPGKQNPLYQDLEEMDHSKENAFTVTMEQMKSMRFIQNYRDEFLELNEKEKRGTFSWENLDLAVITNSDYIMEKMLQETELSNISGSYLSDHKKAMNQGIPLDFKKNKIFFGYIRRKNDETDELMDEFLEFLAEKLKGKTVNERTEE